MNRFFFVLLLLGNFTVHSQDITTLKVQFSSARYTNLSNHLPQVALNRIVVDKKSRVIWKDGHDVVKYVLDIKNVTGALNVSGSGEVTYQVSSEKQKGRVTVKKTNNMIKISFLLIEESSPLSLEFEEIDYTIID